MDYDGFTTLPGMRTTGGQAAFPGATFINRLPLQGKGDISGYHVSSSIRSNQGLNLSGGNALAKALAAISGQLSFVWQKVGNVSVGGGLMAPATGYAVPSIDALKAITADNRTDSYTKLVPGPGDIPPWYAWYTFNSQFKADPNSSDIYEFIIPNDGIGAWKRTGYA